MTKKKTKKLYRKNPVYQMFDDDSGEYWYFVTIDESDGKSDLIYTYSTIRTTSKNANFEELKNKSIAFLPGNERERYAGEPVRVSLASGNALSQNTYAAGSGYSFEFSTDVDLSNIKLGTMDDYLKKRGLKPWKSGCLIMLMAAGVMCIALVLVLIE